MVPFNSFHTERTLLPYILEESIFNLRAIRFCYFRWKMAEQLQNSGDPDQMPHHVASDLGLHFFIPLKNDHTSTFECIIDSLYKYNESGRRSR